MRAEPRGQRPVVKMALKTEDKAVVGGQGGVHAGHC